MTPFERAKANRDILDANWSKANAKLQAVAGLGTGQMGLTPDHVKAGNEYKQAKAEYDFAFARLRDFNKAFIHCFKTELRAERRAKRA